MKIKLNTHLAIVNALRRTLISDIECIAVNEVFIDDTNTPLIPEMVMHRLEISPIIQSKVKDINTILSVNTTADKNSSVLTTDFKSSIGDNPLFPDLKIIELRKGVNSTEYIKMHCTLIKGYGYEHAKFQCVAHAGIIETKDQKDITLVFNSKGQYKEQTIFDLGIKTLLKRVNDFKASIDDKTSTKVSIEKANNLYIIEIDNEDDTLGNMIQKIILDKYDFVAYNKSHPMEKKIIIKIKCDDPKYAMHNACDLIIKEINKVKSIKI